MQQKPKIRFQRSNLVVADIERSLKFYIDVLGFDLAFIKDSDKDNYSYDLFETDKSKPMKFAVLRTSEQANVLALTEVPGLAPISDIPRRSGIILESSEIDRVINESQALGLKVYPEEKLITKDGRQGREFGIVDFDGHLVLVYLITKELT